MAALPSRNPVAPPGSVEARIASDPAPPSAGSTTADAPVVLDVRVVTGAGGGPEKTILNSPRFLQPTGYHNLCAYLHPPGDPGFQILRQRAEIWNAPLISLPDRGPWDWRSIARLLEICRQEKVAIWHGHDYKSNLIGLILWPFWPMRLVTTVHGWGLRNPWRVRLYNHIDRLCLSHYECVICVSERLREQCLGCGVRAERCVVIENAIDTQQYLRRPSRDQAKRALEIPPHRLVIGAVGRLTAVKGFDLLIRAAGRLLQEGFDLEVIIVGEGEQRQPLEALIAELGYGDRIHLLGYRSDTLECYEAMDIYALSSLSEGLPNVVLEAMALRIPVAASAVGAVPQVIAHGENGLLIEPGDALQLGSALARLLSDPDLRSRLANAGRGTVEQRFSFQRRIERIREIYDELLTVPCAAATT